MNLYGIVKYSVIIMICIVHGDINTPILFLSHFHSGLVSEQES